MKVSFVKVVEMQRRGVPHLHAIIRLDRIDVSNPAQPIVAPTAVDSHTFVDITEEAILATQIEVFAKGAEEVELRFGAQFDIQPLSNAAILSQGVAEEQSASRRVAGYLAKYVTKSVVDFGLSPRKMSPAAIELLDTTVHVQRLLHAIVELAAETGDDRLIDSLHTLGYRGHVTTKSRRYSTTMFALRAKRSGYLQALGQARHTEHGFIPSDEDADWEYKSHGHSSGGEHFLALSAALREKESRWAARQLVDGPDER